MMTMPSRRQRSSVYIILLVAFLSGPRPIVASNQLEAEEKDDGRDLCMSDVRSLAVCMLCYHRTNQKMINCCQSMNVYEECLDNISELIKNPSLTDLMSHKTWIDLANSLPLLPVDAPMQRQRDGELTNGVVVPPNVGTMGSKSMQPRKRSLEEIQKDLQPLLDAEDDVRSWEDYELDQLEEMIKRRSPFLGKRRSPFLGKRRSPFLGKRVRSPFLGKRRSPFLGKRRSPFLGKREDEVGDLLELSETNIANEKRGRSPFLG